MNNKQDYIKLKMREKGERERGGGGGVELGLIEFRTMDHNLKTRAGLIGRSPWDPADPKP